MTITKIIQNISIISIVIPIGIGIRNHKTAAQNLRLFLYFLFVGLAIDVTMYVLLNSGRGEYLYEVFTFYSLVEATFFYWFISTLCTSSFPRRSAQLLLLVTPLFWIVFVFGNQFSSALRSYGEKFDPAYEILVALLSGFVLLKLVETENDAFRHPYVWIVAGIFFYCFCTFFISTFLKTILSQRIWFLNNLVNIAAYLFYTVGLWCIKFQKKVQPYSDNIT